MTPFSLRTRRLLLDQPSAADVDDITASCSDPLFERFLVTPWPYERVHAEGFVGQYVPRAWASDTEWTWAVRDGGGPLAGVLSVRLPSGMVGYWLGAAHRGRELMPEALDAAIAAVFARTALDEVLWECVLGNVSSLRVAQKTGFRYTGEADGRVPGRDGRPKRSWTGCRRRDDDGAPTQGWPDVSLLPRP